ncbi:MAG TPA: acyltransferase family protein, partial [Jatrophihabitantaceae bacterium]|nr:acyltransferase family protein [Jatrophihabitantaceae bacterium]
MDWWWIGLLGLALVVRVGYVLATRHYVPKADSADYQRIAASIAHGHGFGPSVIAPGGGPSAFRPPLYPGFLGALYTVVGVHVQLARLAQALLGTVSVGLIGALGHRLFGRRAAIASMGIAAVYPPLIFMGSALLSESLAIPLELAAVLAALHARNATKPWRWVALVGALAGLGVLNRPNAALLLVPFVVIVAPSWRVRRDALLRGALVLGVAALVVAPWLARDVRTMGDVVPLTTQGGLVMAGTYNDVARHDGNYPAGWREPNLVPEYAAILASHPNMGEVEMEQRFRSGALDYVRTHPTYVAEVVAWNTARLFDITGPRTARGNALALGFSRREADLWLYSYYAIAALGIAGLARTRTRARGPRAVWLVPIAVVVSIVPLQSFSRMRAGIEPFIVMLAAVAVVAAVEWVKARPPAVAPEPEFRLGHRPSLDGLRGVAILLVVATHTFAWLLPEKTSPVPGGIVGVDLFFVLSGFLITALLLQERKREGRVSFRGFYRRRALRLLPALWVLFLTHLFVAVILGRDLGVEARTLGGAFFYVSNWVQPLGGQIAPDLAQLWSLAVEEQFYLLWPALLVFALRRRMSPGRIAVVAIFSSLLLRAVLAIRSTESIPLAYVTTWSRLDGLMLGALLAWLLHRGWRPNPRLVQGSAVAAGGALLVLVHFGGLTDRFMYVWGFGVAGLASAALVLAALDPSSVLARLMSWRPLTVMGRLSYSMYVWHLFVFSFVVSLLEHASGAERVVVGLSAALGVSAVSHYFVERPFLRLKDAPASLPRARVQRRRPAFATAAAGLVALLALGAAPAFAQRRDTQRQQAAQAARAAKAAVPVAPSGGVSAAALDATAETAAPIPAQTSGEGQVVVGPPPTTPPAPATPLATVLELVPTTFQLDAITGATEAVTAATLHTANGTVLVGR